MKKLFTDEKIIFKMVAVCLILYIAMFLLVTLFKCGIPSWIFAENGDINDYLNGTKDYKTLWAYRYSHWPIKERFLYQFYYDKNWDGQDAEIIHDVFVNIAITLSIGVCLPILFKKDKLIRDVLLGFFISLAVETTQLLSKIGGFEILDIVCNTVGVFIGALFTKFMRKRLKETTFNKTVNICAFTVSIVEVPLVLFMLINTIINFDVYLMRVV